MRKLIVFTLVFALVLGLSAIGFAQSAGNQTVEVKLTDILDNSAMTTNWGNVYFRDRDVKRLTHAAAKLKPVNLGDFKTDTGTMVQVQAIGFKTGTAIMLVKKF